MILWALKHMVGSDAADCVVQQPIAMCESTGQCDVAAGQTYDTLAFLLEQRGVVMLVCGLLRGCLWPTGTAHGPVTYHEGPCHIP